MASADPCAPGASPEVSVVVPESDTEDLSAPLAASTQEAPAAPHGCAAVGRRISRGCWSLGLLATVLAGAAMLPSTRLLLRRQAGGPATSERITHNDDGSISLYVNVSAVRLGEAGKPHEYLLLKGPASEQNQLAIQVMQGECAFDIIQAAQYLGRSGLQITQSVKTCKPIYNTYGSDKYPGNQYIRTACAADAAGIFSSFGFAATYLSLSASHCADTMNLPAVCAAGATGLVAALAKVAVEASTMAANCEGGYVFHQPPPPPEVGSDAVWQNDRRLTSANKSIQEEIDAATLALQDTWTALGQLNESIAAANGSDPAKIKELQMERDGEMTTCVIDATQAATYLGQFGLFIQKAAAGCPLQPQFANVDGVSEINNRVCAGSIMSIISAILNTGAFVASAVSHCALGINTQALCAQGAVGVVAAVAELGNSLQAMNSACEVIPELLVEILAEHIAHR